MLSAEHKSRFAHRKILLASLTVAVLCIVLAAHWPALSAGAWYFDDLEYLTQNSLVQNPGWTSARRFLTEVLEPSTVKGYYQPLAMISLMLDYALGGRADNLQPFHRTSLTLHLANTALVIVLLYLLFGRATIAAAVGLLFGLHPMTVEPVCWVSDRKTLLAAFFALWSLILYVRYARRSNWRLYAACLITYILALMSKPTALPLPLLMLLTDYWPLHRLSRRTILEKLPFFVIGGIFAAITYISQSRTATTVLTGQYALKHAPLILCHNIIFYLYKIFFPANLSSHYAFPQPMGLSHPMILTGLIGTCILIPLLVISLRWTPALLTGWLVFFVAIFPTIGVIGFTNVIAADKFAYLPSIGLLMILAYLIGRFCSAGTLKQLTARYATMAILILALAGAEAVATRRHLMHWRDTVSLCKHILTFTPNVPLVHSQLALGLKSQGKLDEAVTHYTYALQLDPNYTNTHNDLATVLVRQGRLDEAIKHFRKAIQLDPDLYHVHKNLADALVRRGEFDEAANHYTEALRINPDLADTYNNLGYALMHSGNLDQAIIHFAEALRIDPDLAEARHNLGYALARQGRLDKAIIHLTEALRIDPDLADVHNDLGVVLTRLGRLDEAVVHFTEALRIKPDFVDAQNNLDAILTRQTMPNKSGQPHIESSPEKPSD